MKAVPGLDRWVVPEMVRERVLSWMASRFGVSAGSTMSLQDLFVVKYTPNSSLHWVCTEMAAYGSPLSFVLSLMQ